eukprot:TRINITY_DN51533_c0_g1_i1.p2 TRINITY_DN51533_c0_g1~~TRINITY_DN51533_c0_g1_i1.p2  ORF type:complete len:133 (+),score=15.84 TRINITY_DN51533_c0_g1_i1:151-549(+)
MAVAGSVDLQNDRISRWASPESPANPAASFAEQLLSCSGAPPPRRKDGDDFVADIADGGTIRQQLSPTEGFMYTDVGHDLMYTDAGHDLVSSEDGQHCDPTVVGDLPISAEHLPQHTRSERLIKGNTKRTDR